MTTQSIGFVGGGRVTRISLGGSKQANALPSQIVVTDPNVDSLAKLQAEFPSIEIAPGDNRRATTQSVVLVAMHPPLAMAVLAELGGAVAMETTVVSLAPKFTLVKFAVALGAMPNWLGSFSLDRHTSAPATI